MSEAGSVHRRALRGAVSLALALALALGMLVLAACSSKGGSGQYVNAPTAIATPVGYAPTSAAGAKPVTITVRAGADVQLTGEDSDGGNISITGFGWKQTDPATTPQVNLLYRNSSTVTFTAPSVAANTTLNIQLTVTNALGLAGTADVQVTVIPANDPDRYLSLLAIPHHFRVALSLTTPAANAGDAIALSADAPVCVKATPSISYLARSGSRNTVPLPVQQVDAKWVGAVGAVAGFPTNAPAYLAFRNPVVSFNLPVLNDELLFAQFNQPGATTADVAAELVPSDISQAFVPLVVSATPGSCDGSEPGTALEQAQLMLQLEDEAGSPVGPPATGPTGGAVTVSSSVLPAPTNPLTPDGSAQLTPEDFLRVASLGGSNESPNTEVETRESASAYYAAIDPPSSKTTLSAWLTQNCFDPNSFTYGAGETGYDVVHASYTNNFDLGFGRDMYFATCLAGNAAGQPAGNLAAVVVNYPSLEASANRLGAFLAVAMEYSPPAGSKAACFSNPADATTNTGVCFTKFYVFAPDDRTGAFDRVLSANFDRRGQKYVPGACTACHGGTPAFTSGLPYPNGGNIDSEFMPWDLGAMLFADSDPSFACTVSTTSPACESLNPASYAQASQAANIQQLNARAWRTWQFPRQCTQAGPECLASGTNPVTYVNRFQAPIDLVTKWYGGDPGAATAHAFDDSATPAAWATPGQTAPNDLYHQAFAHYCRSCHTSSNVLSQQFASYAQFHALLAANTSPQLSKQLNIQQLVFNNAQMPLSRLTADRFWVNFAGGSSPAQTLATFINAAGTAPVAMDANDDVIPPGQPILSPLQSSNPKPLTILSTAGQNTLTRFQGGSLDALTQSLFLANYQWSLCGGGAPATPGAACPGTALELIGTPVAPSGSSAGAAQSGASLPALPTSTAGTYYLTLTANSGIIGATPVSLTYPLVIPTTDPLLATSSGCPQSTADFDGDPLSSPLDVSACFTLNANGAPVLGDPPYALQISYDGTTYGSTVSGASLPWNASVVPGTSIDPNTGLNVFVPRIAFNFTPNATGNATLFFQWCDANSSAKSCVRGSAGIGLATGLTLSSATFLAYWDPSVNPDYGTGTSPFRYTTPSGAGAINPSLSLAALSGDFTVDAPSATLAFSAPTYSVAADSGTLAAGANALPLQGTSSQLHALVGGLTYTPGAAFVTCNVLGNDLATGNPCVSGQTTSGVSFNYTLNDTTQQKTATGTINIRALASFQSGANAFMGASGLLASNCTNGSCHQAGGAGTTYWHFTPASAGTTYASIMGGTSQSGHPLVVPGDPAHSAFYTASCFLVDPYPDSSGSTAVNMNIASPPLAPHNGAGCVAFYQWILEGAQLD
jgi:hypothetical protein